MPETYNLIEGTSPLILSQPHPGTMLMDGMSDRLTEGANRLPDTDWHIPLLYQDIATALGATVVSAKYSRYVADLNRDPSGASLYPGQSVTGLCPVDLFEDTPIYKAGQQPDDSEIALRKDQFWQPYHDALQAQIDRIHSKFGYALIYDCHSICSVVPRFFEGTLPDLNLGTANNTSTDSNLVALLDTHLKNSDFSFAVNGRFKGGYITRHYGNPEDNIHAVQMETAQSAYMEETYPFPYDQVKAATLKPVLKNLLTTMLEWGQKTYATA